MTIVDFLNNSNATKVLDDNRLGLGPWPNFQGWLDNFWMQSLLDSSLSKYAHIMSPDVSAKGPAHHMFNQKVDSKVFVTFDSYTSAMEWLLDD